MSLFEKAKAVTDKVSGSVTAFSSDEVIASTIIKAVEKQERVNLILKEKGCNYRVSDIDLSMSIPPSVTFGVRRLGEINESDIDRLISAENEPQNETPLSEPSRETLNEELDR